ncbi:MULTISPECIES: hypothetical protein [unclassified Streptomyces]|uniref:hypothetical protein n=1 Tax=unclassified Streptomyces TaxID=2593676 RepID=UPI002DD7C3B1|nr:hypothetical protein [Streptomyces sp. NBC_01445]WSE06700.1 hypothetical protein OG574_27185 [Streptomyces sp. NBC_01445]
MGMKDQFQDKAEQLANQAKKRSGHGKDEASERSTRTQDDLRRERGSQSQDSERRRQEAQGRIDQGYDA